MMDSISRVKKYFCGLFLILTVYRRTSNNHPEFQGFDVKNINSFHPLFISILFTCNTLLYLQSQLLY
jgi:hypothetical protein